MSSCECKWSSWVTLSWNITKLKPASVHLCSKLWKWFCGVETLQNSSQLEFYGLQKLHNSSPLDSCNFVSFAFYGDTLSYCRNALVPLYPITVTEPPYWDPTRWPLFKGYLFYQFIISSFKRLKQHLTRMSNSISSSIHFSLYLPPFIHEGSSV